MENEEYHYDYVNDNGESKPSEDDGSDPYIWEPLDDITLHLLHKLLVESHHTDDMKLLSHKARTSEKLMESSFVYEELPFNILEEVFEKMKEFGAFERRGGTFVDLGSGTGKVVLHAAMLHPFEKCIGIELLGPLHKAALEMQEVFEENLRPELPKEYENVKIELRNEDFLDRLNQLQGDVWFAFSTLYNDKIMERIARAGEQLEVGAFVITCTRKVPSYMFKVLKELEYKLKESRLTVVLQQKIF